MRFILTGLLLVAYQLVLSQNVESFGVFGGLNIPFTRQSSAVPRSDSTTAMTKAVMVLH